MSNICLYKKKEKEEIIKSDLITSLNSMLLNGASLYRAQSLLYIIFKAQTCIAIFSHEMMLYTQKSISNIRRINFAFPRYLQFYSKKCDLSESNASFRNARFIFFSFLHSDHSSCLGNLFSTKYRTYIYIYQKRVNPCRTSA